MRALSGPVRLALRPAAVRRAGRVLPAAADLRAAAGVHPQRRAALLLRPGAAARPAVALRLLQVDPLAPVLLSADFNHVRSLRFFFCRSKVY